MANIILGIGFIITGIMLFMLLFEKKAKSNFSSYEYAQLLIGGILSTFLGIILIIGMAKLA